MIPGGADDDRDPSSATAAQAVLADPELPDLGSVDPAGRAEGVAVLRGQQLEGLGVLTARLGFQEAPCHR